MGNWCSCLDGGEAKTQYEPTPRTPLIGNEAKPRSDSATFQQTGNANASTPESARKYHPTYERDRKEFETSIQAITTVDMKHVPIASMDKTFQDQGKLYNEIVENYQSTEREIHKFKDYFAGEMGGIPVLDQCVNLLVKRCGGARLTVERKSKNFIDLSYNPKDVSEKCEGLPENVLSPLQHYKDACRHIRNILDHSPQVKSNINILLQDEESLRREVTKADLQSEEAVDAMKALIENIQKLRKMTNDIETIQRYSNRKFKELSEAAKGFFSEDT